MVQKREPRFVRARDLGFIPASHEDQINPSVVKKVLFGKGDIISGEIQMVNWAKLFANKSFLPHYHEDMDEVFVVVSGRAEMKVGESIFVLDSGDAVIVPAGNVHSMKAGENEVEYIVFGSSTGQGGKTVNV